MAQNKSPGFTLIELLVVISIIGILSSIVLALLSGAKEKASSSQVNLQLDEYVKALALYKSNHDYFPNQCLASDLCVNTNNYG